MKLKIILIVTLLLTSVVLSSCIVTSYDYKEEISCNEFRDNSHRSGEFEVEVGDKIRVELCSNPTTGFKWTYDISNESVLQQEDYDFMEPEDADSEGAAGVDIWTFEAVEKGTTEVHMEYSQTWQDGIKAEWTYNMTVSVK